MIKIIGAGMAGLLAARMLKEHDPVVYESQSSLPNNHSAVLRFRSPVVGEVVGVPFKKVRMTKATVPWRNEVADQLAYSRKTTGVSRSDRSIPLEPVSQDRWIAPANFIDHLASGVAIEFGVAFDFKSELTKVISTIPMSNLMVALDYDMIRPNQFFLPSVCGFNIRTQLIETEAYVSLYVPDPSRMFNRVSITGDELIMEYAFPDTTKETVGEMAELVKKSMSHQVSDALEMLGFSHPSLFGEPVLTMQPYSKILPISEVERRRFIHWASSVAGKAYQLGRYATWRPGLLVDDLVKDIRLIDHWIREGDYSINIHEAGKRSVT